MEPQHSPHPARAGVAGDARPRRTIPVVSDPRPPEDVLSYHAKGGERESDFARRWADPKARGRLLDLVRCVECEPALLGASPHLLAVGQR